MTPNVPEVEFAASLRREKVRAARLSIFSNGFLVVVKLIIGLYMGSVAVISEAIHSATDLLAAVIAFVAVRASDAPPDEQHPYGHGKMESVSGVGEALLIIGAGGYILFEAVRALMTGRMSDNFGWGIAVMAASAVINTFVARYLFRVAKKTDSLALEADAEHLNVDVWTSVGVAVGLTLAWLTGIHWFDPAVALIIAAFILWTGGRIFIHAFAPLLDERLPPDEVEQIKAIIRANPEILDWHKLRTRKSGSRRFVDVHIQVDDDMSLRDAHQLTEDLEDQLRAVFPNLSVLTHTEPYEEEKRHHEEIPH